MSHRYGVAQIRLNHKPPTNANGTVRHIICPSIHTWLLARPPVEAEARHK